MLKSLRNAVLGIENIVVDAASIEVNRRQRRAKTDRMDVEKLVRQLVRYWRGEQDVWRVVRVPSAEAEDQRQMHRELEILKQERMQHRVRIQSLLFTQGMEAKVGPGFIKKLEQLCNWRGEAVPAQMKRRIEDEYQRLQLVEAQIRGVKRKQMEDLKRGSEDAVLRKVQELQQLVSIGVGARVGSLSWNCLGGDSFAIVAKWRQRWDWHRRRTTVVTASENKGSAEPATVELGSC